MGLSSSPSRRWRNSCKPCSGILAIVVLSLLDHTKVYSSTDPLPAAVPSSAITAAAGKLPEHIRLAVMSGVGHNVEGEGRLQLAPGRGEHDSLLSVGQRTIWLENFNNARDAGKTVPEAQEIALRGAADGKIYAKPKERGEDYENIPAGITQTDRTTAESVTCMSCHHTLRGRAEVLSHYRGDWHLFNSKRRNSDLAPISEMAFSLRVKAAISAPAVDLRQANGNTQQQEHPGHGSATVCGDTNAVKREGRKAGAAAASVAREERRAKQVEKRSQVVACSDISVESLPDLPRKMGAETCPFDGAEFASVEENLEHLDRAHGLRLGQTMSSWLPAGQPGDRDVAGALTYLVRKVYVGHACLNCGSTFSSAAATQRHMSQKGHCRLPKDPQVLLEELGAYVGAAEGAQSFQALPGSVTATEEDKGLASGMTRVGIVDTGAERASAFLATKMMREGAVREGGAEGGLRAEAKAGQPKVKSGVKMGEETIHAGTGGWGKVPVGYGDVSSRVRSQLTKALKRRENKHSRLSEERREERVDKLQALHKAVQEYRGLNVARAGWRELEFAKRMVARNAGDEVNGLLPAARNAPQGGELVGTTKASTLLCQTRQMPGTVASVKQTTAAQNKRFKLDSKNYYTRKAAMSKSGWGVMNSGYRA